VENRKKYKVKQRLRSIGKQSRESMESVLKKKRKAIRWEGFAEKEGLSLG